MYTCVTCNKEFDNRRSYAGHCSSHFRKSKVVEIKMPICKYCNTEFKNGKQLGGHMVWCKLNPDLEISRCRLQLSSTDKTVSSSTKDKISKSMKIAHGEGRAWNIGKSRWNNEPSYPEKFFMKVIENEFEDKQYIREFPFIKYSIDFAWPHLKMAIEIDGEQHERFPEYAERDRLKDELLIENGWKILRISWKELYNNTKEKIQESKEFIMGG